MYIYIYIYIYWGEKITHGIRSTFDPSILPTTGHPPSRHSLELGTATSPKAMEAVAASACFQTSAMFFVRWRKWQGVVTSGMLGFNCHEALVSWFVSAMK